jgi:hypothetical protein
MPCFVNGQPVTSLSIPTAAHVRQTDETTATQAETIALAYVATEELEMEQLTVHWNSIPTTSESIVLKKVSVSGAKYDTVLRSVDPSVGAENIQDLVCVIPFIFYPGDTVSITYPNTEDQDIGVEILLKGVTGL